MPFFRRQSFIFFNFFQIMVAMATVCYSSFCSYFLLTDLYLPFMLCIIPSKSCFSIIIYSSHIIHLNYLKFLSFIILKAFLFVLDASFGGMIRSNLYPMLPSISRWFSHHSLSTSRDMCLYDQQGIYIVFSKLLVLKQVK